MITAGLLTACGHLSAEPRSFTRTDAKTVVSIRRLHRKAERLINKHSLREALSVYLEILFLEPDDELAYTQTGKVQMILGNFDKAEEAFQNALHINPENEMALQGLQKIHDPDGN